MTCAEWLAFLEDPEILARYEASLREGRLELAPRASPTADAPLWVKDGGMFGGGRFRLERSDGGRVESHAPVTGISAEDALAYAAWRARHDGIAWRLPSAQEWRLAVQGGDGRAYPWGEVGDVGFCTSARTAPADSGVPVPVGSAPRDRSVQGVCDLAGGVSEFTASHSSASPDLWLVLGGNRFDSDPARCSAHAQREVAGRMVHAAIGLRLAADGL